MKTIKFFFAYGYIPLFSFKAWSWYYLTPSNNRLFIYKNNTVQLERIANGKTHRMPIVTHKTFFSNPYHYEKLLIEVSSNKYNPRKTKQG